MIKRLSLFEIHERKTCPAALRNGVTDFLQFTTDMGQYYRCITPEIASFIRESGSEAITDMCSGGGGPWKKLYASLSEELGFEPELMLCDLYPNTNVVKKFPATMKTHIKYLDKSVNALNVPENLNGFRTLFGSFHHFRPPDAKAIIKNTIEKKQGIGIFEFTERRFIYIFALFLSLISVFLFMPFVRPFRWSNIILTYIIPAIPLTILWDGFVSCLRTYSVEELRQMASEADEKNEYTWRIGRKKMQGPPFYVTYLMGCARKKDS